MKRILLIAAFAFIFNPVIADDPGLPGGDPDVPVDGGTAVLLAAGIAYGVRSLKKRNKQKKEGP